MRAIVPIIAAAALLLTEGCLFDGGEGTRGLPCTHDGHCGAGLSCIREVCGGTDACTFSYDNQIVDEGNNGIDIDAVLLTPTDSDSWGGNFLVDEPLWYGTVFELPSIEPGEYDTRVIDAKGYAYTRFGVECTDGDWHWTITEQDVD